MAFRRLWIGSALSFAAMQMNLVGRPWLAFEITGSGVALGVVAVSQAIPMLLIAPFGGVAADRLPKRTVLLASQTVLLGMSMAMALIVIFDITHVWHLALLAFVQGATVPFNQPVRSSYIPVFLDRRLVSNGVALHSAARNLNQIVAPSVMGILLAWDPKVAFSVIGVLHVLSMMVSLGFPQGRPSEGKGRGALGEVAFGFRYMLSSPAHRMLMLMIFLAVLLGMPFLHLLPVFQEVLGVGPSALGLMYTAVGAGGLVGSLLVASLSTWSERNLPQILAGVSFGLTLVGFALSPFFALSVGLLFVVGISSQSYQAMNQSKMILATDPALYGRVVSTNMMIRSFMPMSVLPMGALVDSWGAPITLAGAGALLALAMIATGAARLTSTVRR